MDDNERISRQFDFIVKLDAMKSIERRSPIFSGGRRENDAEHSWHCAVMAMVFAQYALPGADPGRAARMLLVHDLIEIYAGDTFAYDPAANLDKEEREKAAADKLYSILPPEQGSELRAVWEEFDAMETPDAKYAAALDRLQPLLANWFNDGLTWREGHVHAPDVYKRMEPIRTGAPKLWDTVVYIIEESVKKGTLER